MEWDEHLRTLATECRQKEWRHEKWRPSPALVEKKQGGMAKKYDGHAYDSGRFDLVEDGWDHDHCMLCNQTISDCGGENCSPEGFTDGYNWLCGACHQRTIVNKEDPTKPRTVP